MLALAPLAWLAAGVYGVGNVRLGANPIARLTDDLGLWGLRLLLATLTLTPLAQATHWPHWLRLRRMLGLTAFLYLTLHFAMYLAVDQSFAWAVLAEDIVKRPWITLGFAALVLLTPLAITSTRGWMRRLGRRWQRLHYAIYPAAACGCWHFWWQVKRDIREPLAYATVFALLMAWRLGRASLRSRA